MGDRVLYFTFGMAAAVVAMLFVGPAWSGIVEYSFPEVIVTQRELEEREPDIAEPTVIERIRFQTIEPAQLAIAPGGGDPTVADFCRPVTVATTDTVTDTLILLRSGSVREPSIFTPWEPLRFRATGPTNAGDLREYTFHPRGGFDFQASGDSVLVRQGRFAVVRDLWETGSQAYTIFSLVSRLIGG